MKKLLLLLFPFFMQAQDVAIGHWKDYLSYNSASYITAAENKIYCVANAGLFYINKNDETINRLSKITGLSDVGIKQVAYSYELDIVIITYKNCNVDLLKNNHIINISDIKRKEITGIKSINNITIRKNIAYLSTSIGLILVDLENEEIKDTYNVGDASSAYKINGCAFLGDSIITATSQGLFYANINDPNLSDYSSWSVFQAQTNEETYDNIVYGNGNINGDYSYETRSVNYNNSTLVRTKFDRVEITKDDGAYIELTHLKFENILYALNDDENIIWVADSVNGLLKFIA